MLDDLNRKVRQMHAALGDIKEEDISEIHGIVSRSETSVSVLLDMNAGADQSQLYNVMTLTVANIACLKDHLRAWCRKHGVPFNGEQLINSNRSVAIIHDLWNIDKHYELDKKPRSGVKPKLTAPSWALTLTAGGSSDSYVSATLDPQTGRLVINSSGAGSSADRRLRSNIVDEAGNRIGDFLQTCQEAAEAWTVAFKQHGVPINVP